MLPLNQRTIEFSMTQVQIERFWSRVNKNGTIPDQNNPHYAGLSQCWEWAKNGVKGYGRMNIGKNEILAHRISYQLHNGSIEPKVHILHRCDNPACVNPDHLFAGDNTQNSHDARDKGRLFAAKGEKCGMAKLTDQQVQEIRAKYEPRKRGGIGIKVLGREYGVHYTTIARICRSQTWSHI